jgi:hypothetical protein
MPLPVPDLLSLPETVRFVIEATGESEDRVRSTLLEATLAGTITATGCRHRSTLAQRDPKRYFAHPVLYEREVVPSWAWGTRGCWPLSRVGIYDLVRFGRAEIERWLGTAETEPRAEAFTAADSSKAVRTAALSPNELPATDAAAANGDEVSPSIVSYAELRAAIATHGAAPEDKLIEYATATFPQKHVPRQLIRDARDELFGKPRLGRPKRSK